jgi:hypothetical protein
MALNKIIIAILALIILLSVIFLFYLRYDYYSVPYRQTDYSISSHVIRVDRITGDHCKLYASTTGTDGTLLYGFWPLQIINSERIQGDLKACKSSFDFNE